MEKRIITFCKAIAAESNFLCCTQKKSSNLTILQKSHLNTLRSNRDFVILNADKNLGPAIMEREEYLKSVLQEHLLDENTYERIEEEKALKIIDDTKNKALQLIHEYKEYISKDEYFYFIKSFTQNSRYPQFYGTPKVHENKIPVPMRPVVSQCGIYLQ